MISCRSLAACLQKIKDKRFVYIPAFFAAAKATPDWIVESNPVGA